MSGAPWQGVGSRWYLRWRKRIYFCSYFKVDVYLGYYSKGWSIPFYSSHVVLLTPLCQLWCLNSPTASWYRELIHWTAELRGENEQTREKRQNMYLSGLFKIAACCCQRQLMCKSCLLCNGKKSYLLLVIAQLSTLYQKYNLLSTDFPTGLVTFFRFLICQPQLGCTLQK